MQMRAVVFRKPLEPVAVENVEIDQPQRHEVLVRTVASARRSYSDLHVANGTSC